MSKPSKPNSSYASSDKAQRAFLQGLDGGGYNFDGYTYDLDHDHSRSPHIPTWTGESSSGNDRAGMADPFDVRMRFTTQLQHLNASATSSQKAAQYAIKYRDLEEDLHSVILEQLEKNSMNTRANIMYFIEHLCDLESKEGYQGYKLMMQRDILAIVDAVAPEDGSGAANVKVVRKVLKGLEQKQFLLSNVVAEIEECLKERDTAPDHVGLSSPVEPADVEMSGTSEEPQSKLSKSSSFVKLDKRQIEQRIEEDRERHKRMREYQWATPVADNPAEYDPEFEQMLRETSPVGSDDFRLMEEEAVQRKQCLKEHLDEMDSGHGGE